MRIKLSSACGAAYLVTLHRSFKIDMIKYLLDRKPKEGSSNVHNTAFNSASVITKDKQNYIHFSNIMKIPSCACKFAHA